MQDQGRQIEPTASSSVSSSLIGPYGSRLVDLVVGDPKVRAELKSYASHLPSFQVSARTLCDLELLATGALSPLDRFMGQADYMGVLDDMRLAEGTFYPIPVTLPIESSAEVDVGREIVLRSPTNQIIALLSIEEIFGWDHEHEAQVVTGTRDTRHPLVAEMARWPRSYVSGPLTVLEVPKHYDFAFLRQTPQTVRDHLDELGRRDVVAFQTRNPMHRSHEELTKRATEAVAGSLLIHPTVGVTRPDDLDYFTRVRCVQSLVATNYDAARTHLSILPLAMRMAGPREALWHMIIRRNYGANHFIIGRDHASPGKNSNGVPFFEPFAAHELAQRYQHEIGVRPMLFKEFVYLPDEDRYSDGDGLSSGTRTQSLSGTEVRDDYLRRGRLLPSWYTRPEVADILARAYPPRDKQGFCIWLTGLPSAGKSTIAEILATKLHEHGRRVTVLDGDVVRTHLSRGLGFSHEDREVNVLRIGFVASEIVRHEGVVVCAAVSPYRATRDQVRARFETGEFIEVHISTPLEACKSRDVKGRYARALAGELKGLTGVDDPYEAPSSPELTIDTVGESAEDATENILDLLRHQGFGVGGGGA